MGRKYPVLKAMQKETKLFKLILGGVLLLLAVAAFVFEGWQIIPLKRPAVDMYSASPAELRGQKVFGKVTRVEGAYLVYTDAYGRYDCMEFIVDLGDGTYCAVRAADLKLMRLHRSMVTGKEVKPEVVIEGIMERMDETSQTYYRRFVKRHLGVEKLPEEYNIYIVLDETTIDTDVAKIYRYLWASAVLTVAAIAVFVLANNYSSVSDGKKIIRAAADKEKTAEALADCWHTAEEFYSVKIDSRFVCWVRGGRVRVVDRSLFTDFYMHPSKRKIIFLSESKKRSMPVKPFAADIILNALKEKM